MCRLLILLLLVVVIVVANKFEYTLCINLDGFIGQAAAAAAAAAAAGDTRNENDIKIIK